MKNQMSEKRTAKGSSRTLLLFFLSILLSGRSGSGPPAADDFVTFAKSNAKALLTAGVYQKFPCALPGAEKSKGALSEFWDRAHLCTTPRGIVFSCWSGKLQAGQIGNLDFPDLLGNSKPVQVCPACEVVISKHSLCVPTVAACKGNPLYPFTGGGVMPTSGHAGRNRSEPPQKT